MMASTTRVLKKSFRFVNEFFFRLIHYYCHIRVCLVYIARGTFRIHMYNILYTRIIILCIHRCRIHTHSLQRSRRVLYLNLRGVKMANKKTGPH